MFYDNAQPHSSSSDTSDSSARFGMVLAELWHDWFETMSQVAYQTHRVCEFFVENGAPSSAQHGGFDWARSRNPSDRPHGSIDMDKLKECLQSMDPMQAARVMHAVQMMQAMETMLKRRRSRANEGEGAPW
jgi:hypothetical protein